MQGQSPLIYWFFISWQTGKTLTFSAMTSLIPDLGGDHLLFYLLYINAEIKQSAGEGFYRTVKEWFGKCQEKIPIEYMAMGMTGPEKFTLPFCPGCRGLHLISHTK
jgi:hypothetical protein